MENHVAPTAEQSRKSLSSTAAHTPGPWERIRDTVFIPFRGPHHRAAAYAGTVENARLIAAAPELLSELNLLAYCSAIQTLINCARDHCLAEASEAEGYIESARAALAKAEGRS